MGDHTRVAGRSDRTISRGWYGRPVTQSHLRDRYRMVMPGCGCFDPISPEAADDVRVGIQATWDTYPVGKTAEGSAPGRFHTPPEEKMVTDVHLDRTFDCTTTDGVTADTAPPSTLWVVLTFAQDHPDRQSAPAWQRKTPGAMHQADPKRRAGSPTGSLPACQLAVSCADHHPHS
jgi:hypothetical protein